jgi:hypothetical protein
MNEEKELIKIGDLFESKVKDYASTYARITAIGKKNLCFEYAKDLEDLNKGLCIEGSASFEDFHSHYEYYKEKPKVVTLFRYLCFDLTNNCYSLTTWSSHKNNLNEFYIKEYTMEMDL